MADCLSDSAENLLNSDSSNERDRSRSPLRKSSTRWGSPVTTSEIQSSMSLSGASDNQDAKVRLIVSNLPFDVRWQELKDLYKDKVGGEICYVDILEGTDGRPSGNGVIQVKSRELANKTILTLNGYDMKGRVLNVREETAKDRTRFQRVQQGGDRGPNGSADGGAFGPKMGGVGLGFGSGMCLGGGGGGGFGSGGSNLASVVGTGCMQLLSQLGIEPDCITNQIFVANLDYQVNNKKLMEIFQIAGNILQVDIKMDKEGNSRGMATVRYENPIEAVQAIAMFNNQYLFDRQMNVRMDKRAELTPQHIPNRLPVGLRGYGIGLGAGGQPLHNIGHIANLVTLSNLSGLVTGSNNLLGGGNAGILSLLGGGNIGGALGGGLGGLGGILGLASLIGSNFGGGGNNMMGNNMSGNNMSGNMGGCGNNSGWSGNGMDSSSGANNFLAGLTGGFGNNMSGGMFGSSGVGGAMGGGGSFGGQNPMFGGGGGGFGGRGMTGTNENGSRPAGVWKPHDKTASLLVKNLPLGTTWQALKDRFKACGNVKFAEISKDARSGNSTGLVHFTSSEEASKALDLTNGTMFENRLLEVSFQAM